MINDIQIKRNDIHYNKKKSNCRVWQVRQIPMGRGENGGCKLKECEWDLRER